MDWHSLSIEVVCAFLRLKHPMNQSLFNIALPIASIFSFRMLGLFMLIPVFTLYANHLEGATPELIGLALGAYGLSQGLLQIPFGLLSDRFGRKPMIAIGLLLFGLGSVLGAFTHHIYGMIAARVLQGMGAIGSVLIALLADLTTEKERTIAMAIVGATIGLSFAVAFIISPILAHSFGLSGIFDVSIALVFIAFIILYAVIPTPSKTPLVTEIPALERFKSILTDRSLLFLNFSIFCQHCLLTALFFYLPLQLAPLLNAQHIESSWYFYLPILILSFLLMIPLITYTEKRKKTNTGMILSIFTILLTQFFLYSGSLLKISISLFCYFTAFNFLEAQLPSLISKCAPTHYKGTAMGVYSSCQFVGIFAGGCLAGVSFQRFGATGIFITTLGIAVLWLSLAIFLCRGRFLIKT